MYSNAMLTKHLLSAAVIALGATACSSSQQKATLADIDVSDESNTHNSVFVKPKSQAEIKEAYYNYIRNAAQDDKSRMTAINRIAAMELSLTNKILAESDAGAAEEIEDRVYQQSLENAVELLETSLRDFPDAKDNDQTLYQLARTYDQLGRYPEAIAALEQLVGKHPDSKFYAEAQFRLGEHRFITGDYLAAEDSYTEVILTPTNDRFYEKSLFKRGWTRYKQELYHEAVDDYLQALTYHRFADMASLEKSEKDQFDEYFRAIGLVFSHLRGAQGLNEYFADKSDFKYLYHTYAVVADIYLKQERFSDAVETLELFSEQHPESRDRPLAHLKIMEIWQSGNFTDRMRDQAEDFYTLYNPASNYWQGHGDGPVKKQIEQKLRDYIVLIAGYYHNLYQKKSKAEDFKLASIWYERYLKHYSNFARQDAIYSLYANLLADNGDNVRALNLFELAAYDGELVLDKKAAYSTVVLSDKLYQQADASSRQQWQQKHGTFARRYVELYPTDPESIDIIVHAAEVSFNSANYAQAIELGNLLPDNASTDAHFNINNIRARSYLEQQQFAEAESAFLDLLELKQIPASRRTKIEDSIALAIYRQGETAIAQDDTVAALKHFSRISENYPRSKIAATGLYDAAALAMRKELWSDAIFYIESFQQLYPTHAKSKEVARQLSVAYLNSNQNDKAARQLERLASGDDNETVKMTALWQAAQLYEKQQDTAGAIRSYRQYAHSYPEPYPQQLEAMYKLTTLYQSAGDRSKRYFWQNKIRSSDAAASKRLKTDRTNFIAATTVLDLANQKRDEFARVQLREPLAKNLKRKKQFMQDAIKLYGQASSYSLAEVTTEATYGIGDIYRVFSRSLLESERPKNLSADELEQYNILLEDQAFPFEEKAIEFYETNLGRTAEGVHNEWIDASFTQLRALFPVRFERKGKTEVFDDAQ